MAQRPTLPVVLISVAAAVALASSLASSVQSLPFVFLHGLGSQCNYEGMTMFTEVLSNSSGQEGFCIEVGDGCHDSWFTSITDQVHSVCEEIKSRSELQSGYNMVALSQGNVIGRAVIQWCDGPPVNNLISIAGPNAGTASVPYCGSGIWCILADWILKLGIYTSYVQDHLGPAGYVKIPTDIEAYEKGCKFLPKLNNELEGSRNTTYKERFSSLNKLVLIMFENDKVLVPPETAWFGYYASNSFSTILAPNETDLYKEDWIGLRSLNEAGKVDWISLPRGHLQINETEMRTYIAPYLIDQSASI